VAALVLLLCALPVGARTLRFASAFDPNSLDPHSLALLYQTRVVTQIYEGLVNRDRDFRLEPALATGWRATSPTVWRFTLRPGVAFHDGTPFTADDVVFSIERALAKTSQRASQLRGIGAVRAVDPLTVDFVLEAPDAVLPEKLYLVAMMSRAWAGRHGVQLPQDYNGKQETYAVRHANGTGPYRLKSYEQDRRLVLEANPGWWGRRDAAVAAQLGNVAEAVYTVIQQDATRLAALASGAVDFLIDAPFQDAARLKRDPNLKVAETDDLGTQYLGFDQARPELEFADVKGRNPFKDVRVRRAVAHAIDVESIVAKVLRGQGTPTGSFFSPLVDGHLPALEKRPPYDPAKARALLQEAGYPNGFGVTLDCVNVTYRTAVCQAIAAMLAQVGIRVTFQASPSALFFPKLTQATASFFEFGWSPATDPWIALNNVFRTWDGKGSGAFNGGRYSNPAVDRLIDAIRVEPDLARRRAMIGEALRLLHDDVALIPLYRRRLTWVMRPNIDVVQWPNDVLELRWVRLR
jgi:peptide/nickel transport system substrate-binding protein